MIPSYKRKSNIAALVFASGAVGAVAIAINTHKNIWDVSVTGPLCGGAMILGYFMALLFYVLAKGRNGAWVLMAFLNVIGLIVLLSLKDLRKDGS